MYHVLLRYALIADETSTEGKTRCELNNMQVTIRRDRRRCLYYKFFFTCIKVVGLSSGDQIDAVA